MRINLQETAEYFLNNDNFLLLCHESPDGDTVGSATALAHALNAGGKKVNILCADSFTKDFEFMFEGLELSQDACEHIVAVDVADPRLLGREYEALYADRVEVCIDHHASNVIYAAKTYLEPDSASAAEMVYLLLEEMKAEITPVIASCLFTGVSTDTGCFRFSNTTVRTFQIAAKLVEYGADSYNIIQTFFETKTKTYAALEKLAVSGMQFFFDDRCAIIYVTQDMYKKSGSNETETTKLANIPRQIEGVRVGVLMKELSDGSFKASVRTHGEIDASAICKRLGGGGHAGAAACTINAGKNKATKLLLKEIGAELGEEVNI